MYTSAQRQWNESASQVGADMDIVYDVAPAMYTPPTVPPVTIPSAHVSFGTFWVPASDYPSGGVLLPSFPPGDPPRILFVSVGVWENSALVDVSPDSPPMRLVYERQCSRVPLSHVPVYCDVDHFYRHRSTLTAGNSSMAWDDFQMALWRYATMLCEVALMPPDASADEWTTLIRHYTDSILASTDTRWLNWLIFSMFVNPVMARPRIGETSVVRGRTRSLPAYMAHVVRLERRLYQAQLEHCTLQQLYALVQQLPAALGITVTATGAFRVSAVTGLRCGRVVASPTVTLLELQTQILPHLYAVDMERYFAGGLLNIARKGIHEAGRAEDVARITALGTEIWRETMPVFEQRKAIPRVPGMHLALEDNNRAAIRRAAQRTLLLRSPLVSAQWRTPGSHEDRIERARDARRAASVGDMEDLFRDTERLPGCMRSLVVSLQSPAPALKNDDRIALASWLTLIAPDQMGASEIVKTIVGHNTPLKPGHRDFVARLASSRQSIRTMRPQGCRTIITQRDMRQPDSLLECPYMRDSPTNTTYQCQRACASDMDMPSVPRSPFDVLLFRLKQ